MYNTYSLRIPILSGKNDDCINVSIDEERKILLFENLDEIYYFDKERFFSWDSSRNVAWSGDSVEDVKAYLGKTRQHARIKPIDSFLEQFPKVEYDEKDFDKEVIRFCKNNHLERFLKLACYMSQYHQPIPHYYWSTIAETSNYFHLYGEFLTRLKAILSKEHIEKRSFVLYARYMVNSKFYKELEFINEQDVYSKYVESGSKGYTVKYFLKTLKFASLGNKDAFESLHALEPLLFFYAIGGTIRNGHGQTQIGNEYFPNRWQPFVVPFKHKSIYDEIKEFWGNKNFRTALDKIKYIHDDIDNALPDIFEELDCERKLTQVKKTHLAKKYDFLYLAHKQGVTLKINIFDLVPNLKRFENTIIESICVSFLEWNILLDNQEPVASKNPCLYHPLISLITNWHENKKDLYKKIQLVINKMKEHDMIIASDLIDIDRIK